MDYEELLKDAENDGIIVKEKKFASHASALTKGNKILINNSLKTLNKKSCALAEELGHYHTTVGNILKLKSVSDHKQEIIARNWAYRKLVGLVSIISAYKNGARNIYDIADYLNVTEEFLNSAIEYYKKKYGLYTSIDNYIIYFEPFGIMEIFSPKEDEL